MLSTVGAATILVGRLRLCVMEDGGGAEAVDLVHLLSRRTKAEGVGLIRVRLRSRGLRVGLVVEQHAEQCGAAAAQRVAAHDQLRTWLG
eukprot:scaffold19191_cov60-Phaeocystis_antarctica.AAC.2